MRRTVAASLAAISATALSATALVMAGGGPASAAPAEPIGRYTDAVREHVMVETPLDTDGDGAFDRVAADVIRPRETTAGARVPVILDASPYYDTLGRGNESELKEYDAAGAPARFPLFYDNYFVPRGYAVVLADMTGTNRSDGCPTTGGAGEVLGAKAIVDWLNGRARAFRADGSQAVASWSTGSVGMVGKSYDGTLANAVAATGVAGLRTIVPIAAISSWYDYYRMNGVVYTRNGPARLSDTVDSDPDEKCDAVREQLSTGSDDTTGNFNDFWSERDYLAGTVARADQVRASVFAVHGLNDLNVKANHFSQWWQSLAEHGVPRKAWLSQRGHVDPFDFRRAEWVSTLHRWFDFWLKGVDNGIMDQPRVDLEIGPDQWITQSDWPAPEAAAVRLHLSTGPDAGRLTTGPGFGQPTASFTDDRDQTGTQMVADPTVIRSNRLVFLSPTLSAPARLSGVARLSLTASVDQPDTNLTVLVVDYGTDTRINHLGPGEGITTLTAESCVGQNGPFDDACYRDTATTTRVSDVEIVARGWLDAQHRTSLTDPQPLVPGARTGLSWTTLPQDYQFKAGHRIGVVLAASHRGRTVADQPELATVTAVLNTSAIDLPVVGGPAGLTW